MMRKILLFILILFSFFACNLDKLEPAQTKAFMKFFGDVGNTEGVDLLKLDDGYLLLGNNIDATIRTAILIKTDLNGNTIWTASFNDISASAVAMSADSYFIVGDSINRGNPLAATRMSLISTDLDGGNPQYTSLGEAGIPYHGTGVTVSRSNQVIVCGYFIDLINSNDSTFLYGYQTSLNPDWLAVRKWGTNGDKRITSNTLVQNDDDDFFYTSMYGDDNSIVAIIGGEDNPNPLSEDLLLDFNSTSNIGDYNLNLINDNGVLVQTVTNSNNKTEIALVAFDSLGASTPESIGRAEKNYSVGTVIQASDGEYVVLGSTDDHGTDARSDLDFYISKVGIDGFESAVGGFTNIIGGTGDETGAAIVQAEDRGFVFLGTMLNTSDVKIMVLVKVNVKGELIN